MNEQLVKDLQALNWQTIIDFGNSLTDLDDAQWRFLKGLIVELTLETYSDIRYVGEVHRDFVWKRHNVDLELKSQLSLSMYTSKQKKLCKTFNLTFNNSYGTNEAKTLDPKNVADVLIVVRNDGAFAIDKKTVLAHCVKKGDGWVLKIPSAKITNLTQRIEQKVQYQNTIKQDVIALIKQAIPKVSKH